MQLHGDEGMEACAECGVPALRVVHVPAEAGGAAVDGDAAGEEGGGEGALSASAKARAEVVLAQTPPNFAAGVLLDTSVKGVQGEYVRFVFGLRGGRGGQRGLGEGASEWVSETAG